MLGTDRFCKLRTRLANIGFSLAKIVTRTRVVEAETVRLTGRHITHLETFFGSAETLVGITDEFALHRHARLLERQLEEVLAQQLALLTQHILQIRSGGSDGGVSLLLAQHAFAAAFHQLIEPYRTIDGFVAKRPAARKAAPKKAAARKQTVAKKKAAPAKARGRR